MHADCHRDQFSLPEILRVQTTVDSSATIQAKLAAQSDVGVW